MQAAAVYLRELRAAAGVSQAEAAKRIGMSSKSVERWEAGKGEPPITTLAAYVKAMNGSIARLLTMILEQPFAEEEAEAEDVARLRSAIKNASDASLDAFNRYLNLVATGVDPTVAARQVLDQ